MSYNFNIICCVNVNSLIGYDQGFRSCCTQHAGVYKPVLAKLLRVLSSVHKSHRKPSQLSSYMNGRQSADQ